MEHGPLFEYAPLINWNWTMLMQLITVLFLFLILRKLFFERVHNFIISRENAVKDVFDGAEAANRKAEERLDQYNKQIAQIEGEGREIIQKAKAKADAQAKNILDEASQKANNLLVQAEKEIVRQQNKAITEMKQEVSALALLVAEKILEKNLQDSGDHDEFIDKILEEAGTSGWQN